MKLPLQITTRNVSLSEAAAETIREKSAKLETFYDSIMACRVLVEAPHRHKHQGVSYNVRLDITVPGGEIVVKREPNEDLYIAIRDSFDAARRQLQSFARRQRGQVKVHEGSPVGHVRNIQVEQETDDGEEVYFHSNSSKGGDGFDRLTPDVAAKFVEEDGEQASVRIPHR
ncbi:MAG: HPF/RaiA family ribosome-associated protein [Chromatiales bacterium]|jgi:ribosomal subunit interface protein|nr:HPF/RaiA family ribosome-associated protein [Chromatiales bacterium]